VNLAEATHLVRYLSKRGLATAILTQFEQPRRAADPPRPLYAVMIPRESFVGDVDVSEIAYGTWLRGFRMIFKPQVGTFVFEKGQALLDCPMPDEDDPPVEATAYEVPYSQDQLRPAPRGDGGF
jgi:hypothetical protein